MFDELVHALRDVERSVDNCVDALESVDHAVGRIKPTALWFCAGLVGFLLWPLPGLVWHAKGRYALTYTISSDKVHIDKKPHDCAWMAAPLGEKYCHYERKVSIIKWAKSTAGEAIVSYDEGKTWRPFTPAADAKVPQHPAVVEVDISWEKVEE